MDCEICGEREADYLILIEGAKLAACHRCAGAGKVIRSLREAPVRNTEAPKPRAEMEVVEGYGSVISGARKRMGLPIEVLAERINEKLSFLERVEHEKTLPDEKIARKLEKELGIKLLQESGSGGTSEEPKSRGTGGMTLGDILEIQRKEKKK